MPLNFKLDKIIKLNLEPRHKGLYNRAIVEIDSTGKVSRDYVSWNNALYFEAKSCILTERFEVEEDIVSPDISKPSKSENHLTIHMELRPLVRKGEEETQFSMFGTDRIIKDFSLEIYPLSERNNRQAGCTAWGCLAQPADIDFPDIDLPDCICFSLFVTPEVFAHYAEKISTAQIDRAVFRLVGVFGCYAEWSPIISTDFVKVLTANSEHKVDLPNNYSEDILRLGRVAEAHLHLSRTLSFANAATGKEAEAEPKNDASRELSFDSNTYNNSSQEPHRQLLNTLTSLRKAVWLAVSMLCLWMVVRLFFN